MNKTAVITGASTGIGAALSSYYANAGWTVFAIARRNKNLEDLAAKVQGSGRIIPVASDLSTTQGVQTAIELVKKQTEHLDLIANIAGIWHNDDRAYYGPTLWEMPDAELIEVMTVGITAPMLLTQGLLPLMIGREDAQIVNLSGTFNSGGAHWIHYFTSKRALEQFTIALAAETKSHGVRVNCVSPADVATEALVKFFEEDAEGALPPTYVAEFIAHLGSPVMKHVNGQIIELRA